MDTINEIENKYIEMYVAGGNKISEAITLFSGVKKAIKDAVKQGTIEECDVSNISFADANKILNCIFDGSFKLSNHNTKTAIKHFAE